MVQFCITATVKVSYNFANKVWSDEREKYLCEKFQHFQ